MSVNIQTLDLSSSLHPDRFLRPEDSAAFLGFSRELMYRMIKEGQLPPLQHPYPGRQIAGYYVETLLEIAKKFKNAAEAEPTAKSRPGPGRPRKNPMRQTTTQDLDALPF